MQDGLAQASGALEVGGDHSFQFLDNRQAALHLGDDAVLFGEWWEGNGDAPKLIVRETDPAVINSGFPTINFRDNLRGIKCKLEEGWNDRCFAAPKPVDSVTENQFRSSSPDQARYACASTWPLPSH
jgi:hypothetical protein